jgi:hypothetical protein
VLLRIWQYFPKSAKLGEFTLEKHIPLEFSQVLLEKMGKIITARDHSKNERYIYSIGTQTLECNFVSPIELGAMNVFRKARPW